jgi:hypothetical protein
MIRVCNLLENRTGVLSGINLEKNHTLAFIQIGELVDQIWEWIVRGNVTQHRLRTGARQQQRRIG